MYATGGNLLDLTKCTDGKVWWNGSLTNSANYFASDKIPVVPGAKYVGTGRNAEQNQYCFFDKNGDYLSQAYKSSSNPVTVPDGAYFMATQFLLAEKENAMIQVGETPSPYTPYSGQSYPVVFPALGKNLCPGVEWGSINQTTGEENIPSVGSTTDRTKPIKVVPGETYTISGLDEDGTIRIFTYDIDGVYIGTYTQNVTGSYTFTPNSGVYIIRLQTNNSIMSLTAKVQCEKGSSATSYEPYTSTVYGGTLDAVSGVLTVEYVYYKGGWVQYDQKNGYKKYQHSGVLLGDTTNVYNISNMIRVFSTVQSTPLDNRIQPPQQGSTSVNIYMSLDENYSADDVEYCYRIATPTYIQLDPLTVQTLIGDNTVWSDTNGTNEVKYLKKG